MKTRFILILSVLCLIWVPSQVLAQTVPEEAPEVFFKAIFDKKYGQAWQSMTQKSQEGIVKLVLKTEKNKALNEKYVARLFKRNDLQLQRGFWAEFRNNVNIKEWRKQKFQLVKLVSPTEALVKAVPANVELKVWKEEKLWKLGYVETFIGDSIDKILTEMDESP